MTIYKIYIPITCQRKEGLSCHLALDSLSTSLLSPTPIDPTVVLKHLVLHLSHAASSLPYHGYLLVTLFHMRIQLRLPGPPRYFNIDLLYILYMLIASSPF